MTGSESRNDTPWFPIDIIVNHLLPFLDRTTFDACLLLNQEVYRLSRHLIPPWPREGTRQLPHEISCVDACPFAIACGCQTGPILLIGRRKGQRVELPTAPLDTVAPTALAFSPDATHLAIGRIDGSIQILHFLDDGDADNDDDTKNSSHPYHWRDYSQRNFLCITLQRRHTTPIHSLVFGGEDHQAFLVSTSDLDSVYFWQTTNGGDCMGEIFGYPMGFSAIALSPNQQTLVGIDWDGSLGLYPLSNHVGSHQHRIQQGSRSFHPGLAMTTHLQFSKDGKHLFGIRKGDLQRWDLETGEHSLIDNRNETTTTTAILNRDGTYLAQYHKGMIGIESMECQTISHICKKVADQKWTLAFSQDGCMLVAGGVDGQLQFWNNYHDDHVINETSAQKKHNTQPVHK